MPLGRRLSRATGRSPRSAPRVPKRVAAPVSRSAPAGSAPAGRSSVRRRTAIGRSAVPASAPITPGAQRRGRSGLTTRAAILLLALLAVAVTLVYPIRQFVTQRSEIAAMRTDQREAASRVSQLQVRAAQWQDPAFVRTEARRRLHLVMPGETAFVVVQPGAPAAAPPAAPPRAVPTGDWYERLWSTVEQAGSAPGQPSPAPTARRAPR